MKANGGNNWGAGCEIRIAGSLVFISRIAFSCLSIAGSLSLYGGYGRIATCVCQEGFFGGILQDSWDFHGDSGNFLGDSWDGFFRILGIFLVILERDSLGFLGGIFKILGIFLVILERDSLGFLGGIFKILGIFLVIVGRDFSGFLGGILQDSWDFQGEFLEEIFQDSWQGFFRILLIFMAFLGIFLVILERDSSGFF